MINLEYYRVFYYVAAYQSISKAAEQLYISQPAVSKTIQKLEEEMNCALFTRTSHGTILTQEGAMLFSHVSKGIKELQLGEEKVSRFDTGVKEKILVGATESALYSTLLPILTLFNEQYPNVTFQIKGCSTSDLVKMLNAGTVDIALGVTPLPKNIYFPTIELKEIEDVFFVHKKFSIDDSIALTPQMLCTLPIVGVGVESSAGKHIADFFKGNGIEYSPTFTVETSTNVLPFVENRLAIGLAPRWTIKQSTHAFELRELNTAFTIPTRKVFLAVNETKLLTPLCRRFIELIKKERYGKPREKEEKQSYSK